MPPIRSPAICVATMERLWCPLPGRPIQGTGSGEFVSDIFREIDDELRRENLLRLWSRYSRHIIAGIVLLALIIGGFFAWRQHLVSERAAQANRYSSALALIRQGKDEEAAKLFATLADDGSGYGIPAAFQRAALLAKAGKHQEAIAAYEHLAVSSSVGREYRDLAVLLAVMHQLPDVDPQTAIHRLTSLTGSGNPWRAFALDLTAAAKLKAGDRSGALDIYQKLADDLEAPSALRARAAEMAVALKS